MAAKTNMLGADSIGLQMGNTVLSTYIVDNYPDYANEVITFYSVLINVSISENISQNRNVLILRSSQHSSTPGSSSTGSKTQVCLILLSTITHSPQAQPSLGTNIHRTQLSIIPN